MKKGALFIKDAGWDGEFLTLGRIKGGVGRSPEGFPIYRLHLFNPSGDNLREGVTLSLLLPAGGDLFARVERVRKSARKTFVTLSGIDPETVESVEGGRVRIRRSDLLPLPEGEYYIADLLGSRVIGKDMKEAGRVREVMDGEGGQILVVEDGDREVMIPFASPWIERVETGGKRIFLKGDPEE